MMKILLRAVRYVILGMLTLAILGILGVAGAYMYLAPQLPSIEVLRDVQFQVPLRVYTRDGRLIAEFGEMKRSPLRYEEIPQPLIQAFLAAEDDRFFEHPGVDYQGLIRAGLLMITTGEKRQGGSTITMQTAKNFLLSSEKSFIRKAKEIILSLQMEQTFSKEEILELYLNKIYLGQRAYGLAAAAQVYYGKSVDELEIPEIAMIAGLPKAPSTSNPITNPETALLRRNYVLRRMNELGYLSNEAYQAATSAPITAKLHSQPVEVEAPYVAEMIRSEMVARFGEEAYTQGFKVYTSIDGRLQTAANRSLRDALQEYDMRHGYRGVEAHISLDEQADEATYKEALKSHARIADLLPALVISVSEQSAEVVTQDTDTLILEWSGLEWAKSYIDENRVGDAPTKAEQILKRGDIIRILKTGENSWRLAQVPEVSGALVSLAPHDGALLALVGGYDYYQSKFNRVVQAERQPGSNFKPFIYSAALDNGFTLASIINDAPVVFDDAELEGEWRPENYSGKFYGPTRLREALVRSRNLVSIRLLRAIGISTAIKHVKSFGFDTRKLPRDLSLSLGSATLTPYELVRGYAVLANGGYLIEPYYIDRIENRDGEIIEKANPLTICREEPCTETAPEQNAAEPATQEMNEQATPNETAEPVSNSIQPPRYAQRTISAQNVYMITSIMQDVIKRGTGIKARSLGRHDIAGKTGTTNEQRDAWFSGFNPDVVATAWVGFDTPHPLGNGETGGRAALPMWINYMEEALNDRPEVVLKEPPGMITVRIDPETGEYAGIDNENAIFEIFTVENAPQAPVTVTKPNNPVLEQGNSGGSDITNQLF